MPVEHMVWMKFKDGISAERIAEHLAALSALPDNVPGIVDLCVGENFTDRAQGFTHGMIVTLTDQTALENYAVHPNHVAVAAPLKEDADLMAMDFEH